MPSPAEEIMAEIAAIQSSEERVDAARLAMLGVVTREIPDPDKRVWNYCEDIIRRHFEENHRA